MTERSFLLDGKKITVLGNEIKVGDKAPDFTVNRPVDLVGFDLPKFSLSEWAGKLIVINSFPSVDTPVCDFTVHRFNDEMAKLEDVHIMSVSVDMPFALSRYCAAKNIDKLLTTSDYKDLDFGMKYGFVIKELRILSRGIVVIGKDGIVKHVEYVPDVVNAPDFDKALEVIKANI